MDKLVTSSLQKSNSFDVIRLILAIIVLIGHSTINSGSNLQFSIGQIHLRDLSVFCFFLLSGYLITPGLIKNGVLNYLVRRLARIYPAYVGVILVVGFGFSSIWQKLDPVRSFNLLNQIEYSLINLLPPPGLFNQESNMANFLAGQPYGALNTGISNGSLWSLALEFLLYISLAMILLASRFVSKSFRLLIALIVLGVYIWSITTSMLIGTYHLRTPTLLESIFLKWPYVLCFFLGALLSLLKIVKRTSISLNLIALILFLVSTMKPLFFALFGVFCLAYFFINLGESKFLSKIPLKTDISYGMYLYHFPVQQTLAQFSNLRQNLALYILLSVCVSSILAYGSSKLIEVPAQRRAKRWIAQRPLKK